MTKAESLFKKLDGTGRPPRENQLKILKQIEDNDDICDVHSVDAPVGTGKSYIAVACGIAMRKPSIILTPSNPLVDQYAISYPQINTIKGKFNYDCHQPTSKKKYKCSSVNSICSECIYMNKRKRLLCGDLTVTNCAMYMTSRKSLHKRPNTLILDEAHLILDILRNFTSISVPYSIGGEPPRVINTLTVYEWLRRNLKSASRKLDNYQLSLLLNSIEANPELFVCTEGSESIKIDTLKIPSGVSTKFRAKKTIFLSATISEDEIKELAGEHARINYIKTTSEFPVENRKITYDPLICGRGQTFNVMAVARKIVALYNKHKRPNTLVHTTYEKQIEIAEAVKSLTGGRVLINTNEAESKTANIKALSLSSGNIWIAAGCSEGLDLKDDLCRLQIFPLLIWPNRGDKVIEARIALPDGENWYNWQMLKWLIQASGRAVRSKYDYATNVILDPLWPSVYDREKHRLPEWFRESVDTTNF